MSLIIQPPWTRQPQQPLKLASWMGQPQSIFLGPLGDLNDRGVFDTPATFNAVTRSLGSAGGRLSMSTDPSAARGAVASRTNTEFTLVVVVEKHTDLSNDGGVFGTRNLNTTTNYVQLVEKNAASQKAFAIQITGNSSGTGLTCPNNSFLNGNVYNVVATYVGGVTRVFVNSTSQGVTTGGAAVAPFSDVGSTWRVGRYFHGDGVNRTSNSSVYLGVCSNKAVGENLARDISINPWQIFQPLQRRIWVGGAAAGGTFIPLIGRGPGMSLARKGGGLAARH